MRAISPRKTAFRLKLKLMPRPSYADRVKSSNGDVGSDSRWVANEGKMTMNGRDPSRHSKPKFTAIVFAAIALTGCMKYSENVTSLPSNKTIVPDKASPNTLKASITSYSGRSAVSTHGYSLKSSLDIRPSVSAVSAGGSQLKTAPASSSSN